MAGPRLSLMLLAGLLAQGCATTPQAPPPQSSSALRREIAAALEAGDKAKLTRSTVMLMRMGAMLSDASLDRILPNLDPVVLSDKQLWPGPVSASDRVELLRILFRQNGDLRERQSEDAALVPAEYRLVEGIAWDEARKRLFIGTVVDGRLAYLQDGGWTEVPLGSPRGSLFGMAVDAPRRLLWIGTGSIEQTAVPGERMTGLIAVNLDTLTVVRRVAVGEGAPGAVGDVTVALDGTVYASNVVTGAIHRCRPGCAVLETLVAPGIFRNPQGLVLSRQRNLLFVADYISGIWAIDLASGGAKPVPPKQPAMLEGIDGLIYADSFNWPGKEALIAIQNGTRPRRIVKLHLGPKLDTIVDASPIESISPDGPEPTLGTLAERGSMWFVADSQWERYGPGGVIKDGPPPRPTPIRRVPIDDLIITSR